MRVSHVRRWSLAGIVVLMLLIAPPAAPQVVGPPNPAVWVVAEHQVVESDLAHYGAIVIVSGGTLELRGATLTMVAVAGLEPRISVQDGGRLLLNGTARTASIVAEPQLLPDPAPPHTSWGYGIIIEAGAVFEGRQCHVGGTQLHHLPSQLPFAFRVSGTLVASSCTFDGVTDGVAQSAGSARLENVTFLGAGPSAFAFTGDTLWMRDVRTQGGAVSVTSAVSADLESITIQGEHVCLFHCLYVGSVTTGARISHVLIDTPGDPGTFPIELYGTQGTFDNVTVRNHPISMAMHGADLSARRLDFDAGIDAAPAAGETSLKIADSRIGGTIAWPTEGVVTLHDTVYESITIVNNGPNFRWTTNITIVDPSGTYLGEQVVLRHPEAGNHSVTVRGPETVVTLPFGAPRGTGAIRIVDSYDEDWTVERGGESWPLEMKPRGTTFVLPALRPPPDVPEQHASLQGIAPAVAALVVLAVWRGRRR